MKLCPLVYLSHITVDRPSPLIFYKMFAVVCLTKGVVTCTVVQ